MTRCFSAAFVLGLAAWGQTPEATSLAGKPLFSVPPAGETKTRLENNLAEARKALAENPNDPERIIWVGRRLAYLGRFREAIDTYTKGLAAHPNYAKLYRHRGHRYITIRQLDKAIADFNRAAQLMAGKPDEIEPDGQPNRANQPRSTLHFNVWYHLGLAHYLKGDFAAALKAYEQCMKVSKSNDDSLTATTDWMYMTLRRLGRAKEAAALLEPIREKMDILENGSYHKRLLMYKGMKSLEQLLDPAGADDLTIATQGYGVGNWYLYNGQKDKAIATFEKVVAGKQWGAFGFIAAEADLVRLRK
jgi:tetratricopeptide (TPR) repeat protein